MKPELYAELSDELRLEIKQILLLIALIWLVFLLDRLIPLELWGIVPRSMGGLTGIVASPFLHSDLHHLLSNTFPLFVLLTLLAGSRADSKTVVLFIWLLSGALLWVFGRGGALHIGASGLIFGLATFLIASGIFERRTIALVACAVVVFLYGGTLISGVLPFQDGVSWDGHLFGGVAGIVVAYYMLKSTPPQRHS